MLRTNTTLFVLPLLGLSKKEVLTKKFQNAYLWSLHNIEADYCLHLLYKGNEDLNINKELILNKYTTSKNTVYTIKLPGDLTKTLSNIIEGKYSKLYSEVKEQILNFWNAGKDSILYGVLYKTDSARLLFKPTVLNRDIEYWPKLIRSQETLDLRITW